MLASLLAFPTLADKDKTSELPSLSFLEFLAEMEPLADDWVTPADMLEIECREKQSTTVKIADQTEKAEKTEDEEVLENQLYALLCVDKSVPQEPREQEEKS